MYKLRQKIATRPVTTTTTNTTISISSSNNNTRNGARILKNNSGVAKHMREIIRIKQAGLCWHCQEKIEDSHIIVSSGKRRRCYYHDYCARIIHIIS